MPYLDKLYELMLSGFGITEIEEKIADRETRVNDQFTGLRKHGYHIHSVFIHRGRCKIPITHK